MSKKTTKIQILLAIVAIVCLVVPLFHFIPEKGIFDVLIKTDYSSQDCVEAANIVDSVGGYIACTAKMNEKLDFYRNTLAVAIIFVSFSSVVGLLILRGRGK